MKISIITVTQNNKEGLLRAIECVQNQTYKNVEHIIVDGASTDGTVEILRHFDPSASSGQAQLSAGSGQDDNTKLDSGSKSGMTGCNYQLLTISEADSGIYDAINKGIKLANGDVIGLLHSDDLYANENVLENYASVFTQQNTNNKLPTIDAVYSDLVYVRQKSEVQRQESDSGRAGMTEPKTKNHQPPTTNHQLSTNYQTIRYWKTHKLVNSNQSSVNSKNTDHYSPITDNLLRKGWMPPHPTLFIRKEIFEKYGLYTTDLKIASDYEMILRLLYKYKITTQYLPFTTYFMSIGGASNKSIGNILQKSKEDYQAMKMNGINFPILTLLVKNLRKLPQFLARDL